MAQADKNKGLDVLIKELRAPDRVFQIDRDTTLVYVGLHPDDRRPFVRVGAGRSIPGGLLKQIENVILPEDDPLNVGLELAWLKSTLDEGEDSIRYVGSKDRVSQIYNFSGMQNIEEADKRPVRIAPYQPFRAQDVQKDRATTMFFETGNALLQLGSTKVYDHGAARRGKLTLDREYDLISRALSKRTPRFSPEKEGDPRPKGFLWPGPQFTVGDERAFLVWNFENSALVLNPPADLHYALFESNLDPARVEMAISYHATSPGFVETLRRKYAEKRNCAVYTADEERFGMLKRIYHQSKVQLFSDGSALPYAKDVSYFVSRTGSHGGFAYRMAPGADRMAQIIFPLGGGRASRSFDFLRAPQDLEFRHVNTREETATSDAHLTLLLPGKLPETQFAGARLNERAYPLVAGVEYVLHSAEDARKLADQVLAMFAGDPDEEAIRSFLFLNLGLEFTPEALSAALAVWQKAPVPTNAVALSNLAQFFRYIEGLPIFKDRYDDLQKKTFEKVRARFAVSRLRMRDWSALAGGAWRMHVFFAGGRRTLLFAKPVAGQVVQLQTPPGFAALAQDRKAYPRQLRAWQKAIDKAGDPPGYRVCMEFLEKLFEERLRLFDERNRFQAFLKRFGFANGITQTPAAGPASRSGGLGERLRSFWERVRGVFSGAGGGLSRAALLFVIPFALIAAGLIFFGAARAYSAYNGGAGSDAVSLRGDSAEELAAVDLAAPGALESERPAPGEADVEAPQSEVFEYANALAARNGFRRLENGGNGRLRNPDLVFPGDRLRLPDGRLASVERGQHLWEIAGARYRRDYARLLILDRQISARLGDYERDRDAELLADVRERRGVMARLAVTREMRRMLAQKDEEIRARIDRAR